MFKQNVWQSTLRCFDLNECILCVLKICEILVNKLCMDGRFPIFEDYRYESSKIGPHSKFTGVSLKKGENKMKMQKAVKIRTSTQKMHTILLA